MSTKILPMIDAPRDGTIILLVFKSGGISSASYTTERNVNEAGWRIKIGGGFIKDINPPFNPLLGWIPYPEL